MVAGFHARVIEILEDCRLVLYFQVLQIGAGGQIAAGLREEVRVVKTQGVADEHHPLRWGFRRFRSTQT